MKAEYEEFLQERNRDRHDGDGRPDRDPLEIQDWAREHDLPCDDQGHVQFPDLRIEYDIDGQDHMLDVEVMTPHYRGAHVLRAFPSWTLRIVVPPHWPDVARRSKLVVWNQLLTPLPEETLDELRS